MKTLQLRESQAPYRLSVDDETLSDGPVLLEHDGQPVAALISVEEFDQFRTWRETQYSGQHQTSDLAAFEAERRAFERMKAELLRTHSGEVVAIYGGEVIEVGTDIGETLNRVYDRFGYVPCYVQRVETRAPVYKVPYRHVV